MTESLINITEIGKTIWKICTAFNNDLYSVERVALRWMICIKLDDLYYVEWFVLVLGSHFSKVASAFEEYLQATASNDNMRIQLH